MAFFKKNKEEQTNNKSDSKSTSTKLKSKNAVTTIKKDTPIFIISINLYEKEINIMNMIGNDVTTVNVVKLPYKSRDFDEEFFVKFTEILNKYLANKPSKQSVAVYLVLPNECVANNVINIPTIKKKQMDSQLKLSIESLFKNTKELIINKSLISTNKQYSTFYLSMVKKEILSLFFASLSNCKLYSKYATFSANATLNGVLALRAKSRGHSFLFLDIKENSSLFVLCGKGRTLGYFSLQFGYKILQANKLAYENMLTEHTLAEITVLNALEKAKAKKLTMMEGDSLDSEDSTESSEVSTDGQKLFSRKVPKRLPKFMQRPLPDTPESMAYENFRIFIKWALLLIKKNTNIGSVNAPEYVLVNFPSTLNFILEMANEEKEENGIEFTPFNDNMKLPVDILENLELYGALFMNTYNKIHNF